MYTLTHHTQTVCISKLFYYRGLLTGTFVVFEQPIYQSTIFRKKLRLDTKLKSYKVTAVLVLSNGCELWTATKIQDTNIQPSGVAFLRGVKMCSKIKLDRIKSDAIKEELQVLNLIKKLKDYKRRCNEHVERLSDSRWPNKAGNTNL